MLANTGKSHTETLLYCRFVSQNRSDVAVARATGKAKLHAAAVKEH